MSLPTRLALALLLSVTTATFAIAASPPPPPAPPSGVTQMFAADVVYFADAAVATVCRAGRRYPVAMEAD